MNGWFSEDECTREQLATMPRAHMSGDRKMYEIPEAFQTEQQKEMMLDEPVGWIVSTGLRKPIDSDK